MIITHPSAGIAGDPHKLVRVEGEMITLSALYNSWAFLNWHYYWVLLKLIRKVRKYDTKHKEYGE